MTSPDSSRIKRADARIILPTLLAVALFVISIFVVIIPAFRSNIMERKKEMIQELINSAWSVMQEYRVEEEKGTLSRQEAQKRAIADIRYLRYGSERKDYFWITDMQPIMIMHPYRPQLEGRDLSGEVGEDPTGKKLFVEMVRVCKATGSGFVDYMWQWKDDTQRIVPKLSYVKEFKPWGWVIGTGIYIEDVKEEISGMTGRLITVSTVIVVVIALLLLYITRVGLKIETQRVLAETNLRESEKRYKAMVEAATEGTIMVLEGKYIYCNQPVKDMLGYSSQEFKQLELCQIMASQVAEPDTGCGYFTTLMDGGDAPSQFETKLLTKDRQVVDAELTVSHFSMGEEKGFIIIARDIGRHKQIEEELDQSEAKYKILSHNLDIGVFRITVGPKGKFLEANPMAVKILGFPNREALFKISIFDLFLDKADRLNITKELLREGVIRDRRLELKRSDGSRSTISLSAVMVKDESGQNRFCDGTVQDITERLKNEESRENLILELQGSQLFFNRSIRHFLDREVTHCSMNMPIRKAASIMTRHKYSAILVAAEDIDESFTVPVRSDDSGESFRYIGLVTDRDLRERVVSEGIGTDRPVFEIMSSPLITIPDSALIFEAMLLMQEKGVRHLAVKDQGGHITGLISDQQLVHLQRNSSAYLLKEIHEAALVDDIVKSYSRLPRLAKALIDSGANSRNICRIFSSVADAITERLITFALEELGPPPVPFTFVGLGSEGREELTLLTDQDNAIIYEDVTDPELKQKAERYFLEFGEKVCLWLDRCGYKLCKGEVMARNPKWCQPLSVWKTYFRDWINAAEPQDLLEVNIFFDFRSAYGAKELTLQLRSFINECLASRPEFFQFIARNALLYKPPIGFFGNIVVDSSGEKPSTFDIKEAMKPISNFARLYSLKHKVEETNTQERLYRLNALDILSDSSYQEMIKVYDYLLQMRFKHQALAITQNREPDNFINPKLLTDIEHTLLKNTFSQINNFQKRLSYDFTGAA